MEAIVNFLNGVSFEANGTSVTVSLLLIMLGLLYWYSVYPLSFLTRYGIKHPKPLPFFGNILLFQDGFLKPLSDLVKTHGRVCGYYIGRKPMIVVADPDILRHVMVKDFSNFTNRMFKLSTKPYKDCLLALRNKEWKKVRSIVTPTFSTAKLKEMVPLINAATESLMNNMSVHAESGKPFDIHKCFGCFAMDVIVSVAFGTNVDSQNNPDEPFVRHAQLINSMTFFRPFFLFSILFANIMAPLVRIVPNKKREELDSFFINSIKKLIKKREEQPPDQRRRDFLQLILDARSSQESVSLEHFDTTNTVDELDSRSQQTQPSVSDQNKNPPHKQETSTSQPEKKMLTEDEVVGQAFVFLMAGYETSSNTLAFACYLLALHPESQRKVQEEVDDFFATHDVLDYTSVQELKYLDMAISETLRLYPPGFRFTREVDHDCVINGQFFPKGANLELFPAFLHHDPEHWPEPEKFIPERFTPEAKANRHPFVYLPYGAGPRSCVGMRLAQLELRMALAHLFHRFSIVACSETKVPLELKTSLTQGPKKGIFVKITRRNELKNQNPED